MKVEVKINFVNEHMELPFYANPGDAAKDLQANIKEPVKLFPTATLAVPTGIAVALPQSKLEGQRWVFDVRPRSGLALKSSISVLNAPGTVDEGFTGEIHVILHNAGNDVFMINPGDRIAQLMLTRAYEYEWEEVEELISTARGANGFGSTGV